MNSSVQYSALTRLLAHNNRIHDLGEILSRMPVVLGEEEGDGMGSKGTDFNTEFNPFRDLQEEIDREVRASLVTCWLAMPEPLED
jgi:hypothetical protein